MCQAPTTPFYPEKNDVLLLAPIVYLSKTLGILLGRILKIDETIQKLQPKLPQLAKSMLENGYEGIGFHSSSIMIYADKGAAEMFGYSEEEIPGMNSWLFFKPESAQIIMQHLVDKSSEPYRVKAVKKDKSEFEVELKGKDFEINGEPIRAVMMKKV